MSAPEITNECVRRVTSKDIRNIDTVENHHELIVVVWDEPPTQNERDVVEAVFKNVDSRMSETEMVGLEDTDVYSLIENTTFGEGYTSYYLYPTEK